ncbi:hypothetical protein CO611_09240 [Lysobacteraceae bacterium NML03-0222]|nr:hypothetical protein CO611_09240 [Xanthomonadaceae bacterium NML03-0222]
MGRGERVYPDYALLAQTKRDEESARFIWEAKYRIANEASLREAFFQAKSYALRLASAGFALVAVEGVWVSLAREQFAFDKLLHFSWATLAQTEGFSSLAKLCAKSRLETAK